jgi:alginate O-acetyltransferase complex protein AlgI
VSFSDLTFLFYFLPLFFAVYYIVPFRFKNTVLVLGSAAFYFLGAGVRDCVLLGASVVLHYALARGMEGRTVRARRALLVFGLCVDLFGLVYFKYAAFLLENLGKLTGTAFSLVELALPLGISFYLFQSVGYLIDVSRGRPAEKSFVDFSAFVLAFPQLTMGPILRYDEWRGALKSRTIAREDVFLGFERFLVGLCFKVLLADQLAPLWASLERIGYGYLSTPLAWLGAVSYSLQLYFDFSGYSLMAMGLGQMLGLPVPRNFDLPYLSRSVSEFYRRWHITLGTWFRDYLYIPLGGSRNGKARTVLSLTVVWVFTGLWHGASWNFVLWGVVLLCCILLEKFCIGSFLKEHRVLSHVYLLFVIPQTWVIFRITRLSDVGAYFSRLFPFFGTHSAVSAQDALKLLASYWWLLLLAIFFCLPQLRRFYEEHRGSLALDLPLFLLFWVCVYFIATSSSNAFLYSRF